MSRHELCKGKCTLLFCAATSTCLPFSLLPPCSCGHGGAWRHAGTNPKALGDSGIPAQPGPAGWDLGHNADRQAQIWRLPGVWYDAVTPSLSQQLGEEAANDQNRGTEAAGAMVVGNHVGVWAVLFETHLKCCVKYFLFPAHVAVSSEKGKLKVAPLSHILINSAT